MAKTTKASTELFETAKSFVESFIKRSEDYCRPFWDRARTCRRLYEAKNDPLHRTDLRKRADLKLPIGFTTVESILPVTHRAFFGEEPYIDIRPRGPEDVDNAEQIRDYIQFRLESMRLRRKWIGFEKNRLVDGTAIAKVPWKRVQKKRVEEVPAIDAETGLAQFDESGAVITENRTYVETIKDEPDFEVVDIYDFFPDPAAISCDIQLMRGCAHRSHRTYTELKNSTIPYINLDRLRTRLDNPNGQSTESQYLSESQQAKGATGSTKKFGDKLDVYEYWGEFQFTVDPDTQKRIDASVEEAIITICEGVVIRCDRNPFKKKFRPFIAAPCIPRSNEFFGIGVLDKVEHLIREQESIRNAQMDMIGARLAPPWTVDRNSNVNLRSLKFDKNAIILHDGQPPVPLQVPDVSPNVERAIGRSEYDIQNATGQIAASQAASNVGQAFGNTATGIGMFQKYMADRVSMMVMVGEEDALVPLADIIFWYSQEFADEEGGVIYRTLNIKPTWLTLPSEALDKQVDFIPVGADRRITKGMMTQLMDRMLTTLGTIERARPNTTKWEPIITELFKSWGFQNPNKFAYSDAERNQMQQQAQQADMEKQQEMMAYQKHMEMQHEQSMQDKQARQMIGAKVAGEQAKVIGDVIRGTVNGANEE